MVRWLALAGAALLAIGSSAQAVTSAEAPETDVEVVCAQFGLFDMDADGRVLFTPSATVPLTIGQDFGWVILLRAKDPVVRWREEFQAPARPKTWGPMMSGRTISRDGTTSLMDEYSDARGGIITHAWQITEGDPTGHYVMRVLVGGTSLQIFEFEGVPGPTGKVPTPPPGQPVDKAMHDCAGAISRAESPKTTG
ncbi:MAG TPA: hypothetical protein VMG55_13430 [Stellaceae bacterium]|nr:hypothetical protein [Stellaceae bacterium]